MKRISLTLRGKHPDKVIRASKPIQPERPYKVSFQPVKNVFKKG